MQQVYNKHGMAQRNGTGMFPREVMNRFPLLLLEEEGRLNDMPLRENFIERVFSLRRNARRSAWQCACGTLHDRMDADARRGTRAGRPGQVPYRPQAHPHGPPSPGQAAHPDRGQAITPRWAALSPTRVSEIGTN
jgi:hypothetical protein